MQDRVCADETDSALDLLRRWMGGDDEALEEWLGGPGPATPARPAKQFGDNTAGLDENRGFLGMRAHPEAG